MSTEAPVIQDAPVTTDVNTALAISQLSYMLQNAARLVLRRHYNARLQTYRVSSYTTGKLPQISVHIVS